MALSSSVVLGELAAAVRAFPAAVLDERELDDVQTMAVGLAAGCIQRLRGLEPERVTEPGIGLDRLIRRARTRAEREGAMATMAATTGELKKLLRDVGDGIAEGKRQLRQNNPYAAVPEALDKAEINARKALDLMRDALNEAARTGKVDA